jgi:hypothetical protein
MEAADRRVTRHPMAGRLCTSGCDCGLQTLCGGCCEGYGGYKGSRNYQRFASLVPGLVRTQASRMAGPQRYPQGGGDTQIGSTGS